MDKKRVKNQLDNARNELLELSRRSPLINFKPQKIRGFSFSRPASLFFETLVNDKESFYLVNEEDSRNYKNKIELDLDKKELNKKLLNLYYNYKFYLEERGINSLYISLGVLHWKDQDKNCSSPLILIPVEFFRKGISSAFYFQYNEEDFGENLSLKYKLKKEFKIELPDFNGNVEEFFKGISAIVKEHGWTVEGDLASLGFFGYGKFLMFHDLDDDNWQNKLPSENDNLNKLLNDGFFKKPDIKEMVLSKKDSPFVTDIDSSQLRALQKVKQGQHLIIQGPPGTGKSQTITNIISQALAENKTVLFVSEKKAALEVVKSRMQKQGLDRFCLELHSQKTNKKEFIQELKNTLKDRWDAKEHISSNELRLVKLEEDLSSYGRELLKKYKTTGLSPYEVFSKILYYKQSGLGVSSYFDKNLGELTLEELSQRKLIIDSYIKFYKTKGMPQNNPFYGSNIESITPFDLESILELKEKVIDFLEKNVWQEEKLQDLMKTIEEEKDQLEGFNHLSISSLSLEKLEKIIENYGQLRQKYVKYNWQELISKYFYYQEHNKWWIKFSLPKYNFVKSLEKNNLSFEEFNNDISSYRELVKEYQQSEHNLSNRSLEELQQEIQKIVVYFKKSEVCLRVRKNLSEYLVFYKQVSSLMDQLKWRDLSNYSMINFNKKVKELKDRSYKVYEIITFNKIKEQFINNKLEDVLKLFMDKPNLVDLGKEFFEYNYYLFLMKQFFKNEAFISFNSEILETLSIDYVNEDVKFMKNNKERLVANHRQLIRKLLEQATGLEEEFNLILKEMAKKQRHLPIRIILEKSSRLIQKIKPVLMMSPVSVATYLPQNKMLFDLVIFDEASQIKPIEAFGSICRGKQVIIVGDNKQLPPTSFFEHQLESDIEEDDETISDMESILDLASSKGMDQVMLNWHYRSLHPSLINISNQEFYNNELVTFPSPQVNNPDLGLKFVYVENGVYDRGRNRHNLEEAKVISKEILNHVKQNPDKSLGVVAFNLPQTELIISEVEKLRSSHPELDQFFSKEIDPLFIKNLENVQGDERDVIFISLGYGKDENNKLNLDFGPINRTGGERRLNVLISRAKLKTVVFSSIKGSEIDLNKSNARGVAVLKNFLQYAESNDSLIFKQFSQSKEIVSYLKGKLKEKNIASIENYGNEFFQIDLAVLNDSGEVILGIVLDGNIYSKFKSPRDREVVFRQMVSKMNWKIYKMWSANLIRHSDEEILKLLAHISELVKKD